MGVEERIVADIGRGIAGARLSAGLTQSQMAERAGVTVKDISRMENGNSGVSWGKVVRVMEQLNQPLPRDAHATRPPSLQAVKRAAEEQAASRHASKDSIVAETSEGRLSAG